MASKSVYLCRECLKVFTYPTWCDDCCKCIECCRCLAWGRAESNPCERCGENEIVEPAPAGWCQECWEYQYGLYKLEKEKGELEFEHD